MVKLHLNGQTSDELFRYDERLNADYGVFCGIDEAGRGPLAGDVYAAAVVLPRGLVIDGLNDSKKLTAKKRELLYDEITEKATAFCVATATVDEIDSMDILQATFLAMTRAYNGLEMALPLALVDGNRVPRSLEKLTKVTTVIKGDGTSASIAAASILAKVSRDRYMKELSEEYPEYQFDKHKGYGTKLHYQMLQKFGVSPVHRRSFLKNLETHYENL